MSTQLRKVALVQDVVGKREVFPSGTVFFVADELVGILYLTQKETSAYLVQMGKTQADLVVDDKKVKVLP
jgi:hypothetical protein